MGITGLLPFLKSIQRDIHVSSLKGLKVGVDAYCWLHKGAYSCATQIVMKTADIQTLPFINYCLKRVNLLRQYDITPIIVFDGGYLPTKANTEKERRQKRQSYLLKGKDLLKQGKKSEAHDCFQKSVDISPEMALFFIKECRKLNVQCIVAPYEADAQLAYLSKEGLVDAVITEDSDLLVFGTKKVLYKMDEFGNGKMIEMKDLGKANKNIIGFTEDSFRQMCILSGCDYLPSVPGIGLGKASKLMRKHNKNATQAIRALRCENSKVPSDYEINFKKAEFTFLYQLVFDPRTQQQVRLNELPEGIDPKEFEFAGVEHSPQKAVHMARGNINPITMEVLDAYSPSKAPPSPRPHRPSSWSCSAMGSANKRYPVAIQAKLPITSSARLSRPFKPPSKVKSQSTFAGERSDGALRNEQLLDLYAGSSTSDTTPKHAPASDTPNTGSAPCLSEFFDRVEDSHSSELTPDETDSDQLQQCARRLQETEANEDSSDISCTPCASVSVTSVQTGPKKRLFTSISSKFSQYMYSNSKRRRSEGHVATDDVSSIRRNPFSMSRQTQSQSDCRLSPITKPMDSPEKFEASTSGLTPPITMSSTFCPTSPVTCTMTSTPDPISPFAMASTSDSVSPVAVDSSCDLAISISPNDSHSRSRTSVSPVQSWLGTGDYRRQSLPNPISSSKRKQGNRKVGLSKKVKPARLSDPGPCQNQLAAYSFIKKPKMKL